jgi:hypothetical protein
MQEAGLQGGFVSDGSTLHEWAYGHGRIFEGANGHGSEIFGDGYRFTMGAFGEVVKRHARTAYTDVIHLPVEFPLPADGHRPVSEAFRHKADEVLMESWTELGFHPHIIGGTPEERATKIIETLNLAVSPTMNGPEQRPNGKLWYSNADDALGASDGRYFSSGFRNTSHRIYDIEIDPAGAAITSKVDLNYFGCWSKRGEAPRKPHLTSIDSILIAGQLAQMLMYAQDGITRAESNNLWLRDMELMPGCKPTEEVTGISAALRIVKNCTPRMGGKYWHTSKIETDLANGGFRLNFRVCYELPERLQLLRK